MNKFLLTAVPFTIMAFAGRAQQGIALTANDYERAESRMSYNTEQLVDDQFNGRVNWLPGDKFWYRKLTATGSEFVLADPAKGSRAAAFDHVKLAAALSTASGKTVDAAHLPFQAINFSSDGKLIGFQSGGKS